MPPTVLYTNTMNPYACPLLLTRTKEKKKTLHSVPITRTRTFLCRVKLPENKETNAIKRNTHAFMKQIYCEK